MQLDAELRTNPALRADKFVERWQKLDAQKTLAYRQGEMPEMRRIRDVQGAMATSLERDPQSSPSSPPASRRWALSTSAIRASESRSR